MPSGSRGEESVHPNERERFAMHVKSSASPSPAVRAGAPAPSGPAKGAKSGAADFSKALNEAKAAAPGPAATAPVASPFASAVASAANAATTTAALASSTSASPTATSPTAASPVPSTLSLDTAALAARP